jgi:hypothetical protein
MSVEMLTYAALSAHLKISPEAARALAKRHRLPRLLSPDGKALVSVDLAEIRHTPRPPSTRQAGNIALLTTTIETLQAEIARLEAETASHRADFEHERDRADRLMVELLQATAAKETTPRLEGELRLCGPVTERSAPTAAHRLGRLAATIVEADRKALSNNQVPPVNSSP